MHSALPHLITTAASRALSLRRLRGSRSDRSCHPCDHTSPCAESFFMQLSSKISVIQRREGSPAPPSALALGRLIGLVTRQQRPDNTSILVRDRDRRAVVAAALDQLPYPVAAPVRFEAHPAHRCPRAMDKACAPIAIAPFAHTQQARLTSVESWRGTRSSQVANGRPFLNALASLTAATKAVAVKGPLPGSVSRR
jgi:hypothetical protein